MVHCLPNSAWADGNLAEETGQLGKMVEHPNPSQPNPGLRAHESPCSLPFIFPRILGYSYTFAEARMDFMDAIIRGFEKNPFHFPQFM